jgi:hypothetical protein
MAYVSPLFFFTGLFVAFLAGQHSWLLCSFTTLPTPQSFFNLSLWTCCGYQKTGEELYREGSTLVRVTRLTNLLVADGVFRAASGEGMSALHRWSINR